MVSRRFHVLERRLLNSICPSVRPSVHIYIYIKYSTAKTILIVFYIREYQKLLLTHLNCSWSCVYCVIILCVLCYYLVCIVLLSYVYCVIILCVLCYYLVCIVLLSCVYLCFLICIVLLCVYCCLTYFSCRIAGYSQKSVSGRSQDRPPRHRFFLVSLCLKVNAEMVPKTPSCYCMLLM